MKFPLSKKKQFRKQNRISEVQEIELLEAWIDYGKPDSGLNPLSLSPLPNHAPVGRLSDSSFSHYAGCARFSQLPLSQKTRRGLRDSMFVEMTDIQRASLPHALCGRDILGAAKTGSGKTMAFLIPVLEKLFRLRWGHEDGVGCIIITPTRELAGQIFDVLKSVGRHHNFSAGLLIGGRKDVDSEKERVNGLNILICTPGRLLQHMDETPNFDCSQLQVLVLDEADRILDVGFKKALNAIISQLPMHRQTLLFSATQTKSVQDLARLSLKDPEYLSVHEESLTATPNKLQQTAMVFPLNEKLDMLWSFIKSHLKSRILVFLSSCKQVTFVFEMFKKLRPGIPLKCLHGKMKQGKRMGIYSEFCQENSVLFSTDVVSRGLDFNKGVDWVVQVDCPEDVAAYIHRVGRTARYMSAGRSLLFVLPSELKILEKLQKSKIPIHLIMANKEKLHHISGLLAALLVEYPNLQNLAKRAFVTYLKSIYIQNDKDVFDVMKLPIDEFAASLGLPMTPKLRFLNQKRNSNKSKEDSLLLLTESKEEAEEEFLQAKEACNGEETNVAAAGDNNMPGANSVLKKRKKLKINIHKPLGTRIVFDDDEDNTVNTPSPPKALNPPLPQLDLVHERYARLREEMKEADMEDKAKERERLREKRRKEKAKLKMAAIAEEEDNEEEDEEEEENVEDEEFIETRSKKRAKSDSKLTMSGPDSVSLQQQEAIALKLLSSMHS